MTNLDALLNLSIKGEIMQLSLLLQSVFYDRPRMIRQLRGRVKNEDDLHQFIQTLAQNDPFRSEAQLRMKRRYRMLDQMRRHHIQWVDIEHASYPAQLHQLYDPPLGLFYKGKLVMNSTKCLGLVGSRKASVMAPYRVESLMSVVSDYCIVSGGALGVDALVHDHALSRKLPTIAVLASGLDQMVPQSNFSLFQRMIQSGYAGIVSECPPGVRPRPYFFPQRNRIIAALSTKLIVVEAAKRSGALITANLALGMAADVAAMVGAFNSPQSEGCYQLMNDGAAVIGNHQDLCDFLDLSIPQNTTASSTSPYEHFLEDIPVEPIHIHDLAQRLSLSIDKLIEYVTVLSLNGDVIISSGQMVAKRA